MSGDFRQLPRCGAKVRSKIGVTCKQVAMANGRCYFHGGKSTGPKTEKGLKQMKKAKTKHGYYTKERIEERRYFRMKLNQAKEELENILKEI